MLTGAIVGFGNVAEFGHWPAYSTSDECRIVAAVDASAERRRAAERIGLKTYATLSELNDTPIDFVDICTPPATHFASMLEATERGWNVLCEKPLLLDLSQLGKVRRLGDATNVAIVPAHNWKYAPIIRRATDLLGQGTIGALRSVRISTLRTKAAVTVGSNWRHDPQLSGGGILMDHGWHAVYLALHWFGEKVVDVEAELHADGAVEDEAVAKLTFPSGAAEIVLSWKADRRENAVRLCGDRGEILINDDTLVVNGRVEHFAAPLSAGSHHADWFAAMLPDVLGAFRNVPNAQRMFEEAAECLRVIRIAYKRANWREEVFACR